MSLTKLFLSAALVSKILSLARRANQGGRCDCKSMLIIRYQTATGVVLGFSQHDARSD